jgi:ribosome-associated toxin RatA of RatAB toxin-antitoxin module
VDVRFNDTQRANVSAQTLFEVITDYANYPNFNPSVTNVTVLRKDNGGAEFRTTMNRKISNHAHVFDKYEVGGTVFKIQRTYDEIDGSSTWIVRPAGQGRSTLTINGTMRFSLLHGLVMKLLSKRIMYETDFKPFIEEAERRKEPRSRRAA